MLKIAQACTSLGSSNAGTEDGPQAILENGLIDGLHQAKLNYELLKPVVAATHQTSQEHRGLRNYDTLVSFNKQLYQQLTSQLTAADNLLVLGGDHSIGIGSMFAARSIWPEIRVVYIDAHPDCHEQPEHTTSGNLHGLPVSTVLGDGIYTDFDYPKLDYSQIAFLGLKDIDPDEQNYLEKHQLLRVTVDDIIEHGLGEGMTRIWQFCGDYPLHVVLDIDSIDALEAPGTGIPNRGGLSYREISYIVRKLSHRQIQAIDAVEVNPHRDDERKTSLLAAELILTLMGQAWSPYTRYLDKKV